VESDKVTTFRTLSKSKSLLFPSIFILVRSLGIGGTERQVSVLAQALHQRGYKVTIGVFYPGGILEQHLREAGVSIYSLNKKGRWDVIGWFLRYLKALRDVNPDVIYSFLTVPNLVASIGNIFIRKPVVWGIRASYINFDEYDWLTSLSAKIEKILSRFVKMIIFNAYHSRNYHQSLGYYLKNPVVISNGIDTDIFKPNQHLGKHIIRKQLNIPEEAFVIGMLARVDPMKDYETFLVAAQKLLKRHKNLYFVVAGAGTDMAAWGVLPAQVVRLGIWKDIPGLLNALDVMVLSSLGEGFPNVIGEAMACGIPTIATNVGDAAYIIGDQGKVIPPKNSEALIEAIEDLLKEPLDHGTVRSRIVTHFSVPNMVDQTVHALTTACSIP